MKTDGRARSFWGWGYEDRSPDAAALAKLARRVSGALGGELSVTAPPRLEDVRVAPSRVRAPRALASFTTDDREARIRHTHGRSFADILRGFRGDFSNAPDLVALPRSEEDIHAVLAWARQERVAVIPWGGGTSVVGGVEAALPEGYAGTLSLDLCRLCRVLEVDEISRAARIEAGATGPQIESALGQRGLTLRHFPQSFEFSTLGGWIATRAGGHFASLHTHIDDFVESVRMVTPTGVWQSRRLPASGAGPSPDRLVLGSEGILGVITEAWLRVHQRPAWRGSASVRFAEFSSALAALRDILQEGLYPANCRVLDSQEALLNKVADDGSAVLLLGFESSGAPRHEPLERALELAGRHGGAAQARTSDDATNATTNGPSRGAPGSTDAESWRAAFFDGPYLLNGLVQLGLVADTFETACTWERFAALHEGVSARMLAALEEHCGAGVLTCRITHAYPDGLAPYYTFIGLGRPGAQLEQWRALKREAGGAVHALGGTITHHHAVGRLHRPWYDGERPEPFARALQAAKQACDPGWTLNPGVLVPGPNQ